MDDNYRQLAKIFDNIPRICSKCSGPFEYMGAGEYKCKNTTITVKCASL